MIYHVYCTHNKKINRYLPPIFRTDDPEQVADQARAGYVYAKPDERMPELDLYHIGEFDNETGKITFIEPKLVVSNAVIESDLKQEKTLCKPSHDGIPQQ
jgi:hypothetical protein